MHRSDRGVFYSFRDTYPFLLQELLNSSKYHVVLRARGRNNVITQALEENLDGDVLFSDSKYIIFQLGIVDCAPRLFNLMEDRILFVLGREPIVKIFVNAVVKFKSKHRRFFTKHFPRTYVSKKEFKDKYAFILRETKNAVNPQKVFLINIADTNDKNNLRSFNFRKNILEYNKIIADLVVENKNFCELIDFFSATKEHKEFIVEDEGIHLTKSGHAYLAQIIYEKIQKEDKK